jgi:hypothetical protein
MSAHLRSLRTRLLGLAVVGLFAFGAHPGATVATCTDDCPDEEE